MENRSNSSNSHAGNRKKKKNICHRCDDDWTPGHKCRNNEIIQCKIINGKEVQVFAKEVSSDSNTDTKSKGRTTLGKSSFEDKAFPRGRQCYEYLNDILIIDNKLLFTKVKERNPSLCPSLCMLKPYKGEPHCNILSSSINTLLLFILNHGSRTRFLTL